MERKKSFYPLALCLLASLLCFPSICYSGAKTGINLWFTYVIPSLLPFLIVSNLIVSLNLCSTLCDLLYPIFKILFGIKKPACYPVLLGLISGYPIGAKTCADLVRQGTISVSEGQYLLSFVNNASPTFIMCFLGVSCLDDEKHCHFLCLIILLSSFFCSIVFRNYFKKKTVSDAHTLSPSALPTSKSSFVDCLNHSFLDAFQTIGIIGGYIVLCSILQALLMIAPEPLQPLTRILCCLTEVTTGITTICQQSFPLNTKIILTLPVVAFGGLSSLLQTQSVIAGSGLSLKYYLYAKLCQSLFTCILCYGYLILIV